MKPKSGISISILPDHHDVLVSQKDQSVLDVALRLKIPLNHTCGGNGTCGTCLVHIVNGIESLEPRTEIESEMAEDRKFPDHERLACQLKPHDHLVVEIKKSN
ncbi:2Fe-2S iron-sulfur cluster-binding protein [Bdellovibrio reynosensis]|uniref:(2Fe-2S)-binding protein n=1 Tax=Bdellovibrio reynosensis TaxID=2835041 RepID=A0ABY4C6Z0_9BACT|nr:2Fe-2S iron-sulfur cluster-binding protein [Bdellovibrio reynosensis]UOF00474.1 (2Fe-2S)-binding protein [Bdellovibrio reynosensis]